MPGKAENCKLCHVKRDAKEWKAGTAYCKECYNEQRRAQAASTRAELLPVPATPPLVMSSPRSASPDIDHLLVASSPIQSVRSPMSPTPSHASSACTVHDLREEFARLTRTLADVHYTQQQQVSEHQQQQPLTTILEAIQARYEREDARRAAKESRRAAREVAHVQRIAELEAQLALAHRDFVHLNGQVSQWKRCPRLFLQQVVADHPGFSVREDKLFYKGSGTGRRYVDTPWCGDSSVVGPLGVKGGRCESTSPSIASQQ